MKLLVCIAFHYAPERLKYLHQVLTNVALYGIKVKIIIDTNIHHADTKQFERLIDIEVCVHENLAHPFHLTWMHRKHIRDNINNYDVFMYIEDDMLVPYENFLNYLENFKIVWPQYVPSFVRIEQRDGVDYISDIPEKQPLQKWTFAYYDEHGKNKNKTFSILNFPINYHAFWIMPQKELKETMKDDFVRLTDGREFAAMYTGWELGKPTLIELDNNSFEAPPIISKKCYSYHLPNNYALSEGTPNGKIKPEDIFI